MSEYEQIGWIGRRSEAEMRTFFPIGVPVPHGYQDIEDVYREKRTQYRHRFAVNKDYGKTIVLAEYTDTEPVTPYSGTWITDKVEG